MNKLSVKDKWMESWKKDISPRIRLIYWQTRARFLETILKICYNSKLCRHAEHIHYIEEKCRNQAEQITDMQEQLTQKNKRMKALNILVACDGNCNRSYMDDPYSIDQEIVDKVKRNYERFMHWWNRGGQQAADLYMKKWNKKDLLK
jgi:hypothetical protein